MILNNNAITIQRFTDTAGKKAYIDFLTTPAGVYIEPLSDDVLVGEDGIGAFEGHLLMSKYTDIIVGDKITDKNSVEYKVKGVKTYNTFVGKHIEAIIQKTYD